MDAYIAGLFEGEGCINSSTNKSHPNQRPRLGVSVKSTDGDVIQRLHEAVGDGYIYGPYMYKGWAEKGYKPVYSFQLIGAEKVRAFFERVKPWLGERRTSQFVRVLAEYDQATLDGRGRWRPVAPVRIERDGEILRLCSKCGIEVSEMTPDCTTCYGRHHGRQQRIDRRNRRDKAAA